MAITVTTRAVKGSALIFSEMDANFNNLAVSSTQSAEGNIEIATQAEHTSLSDETKACVPGFLTTPVNALATTIVNAAKPTTSISTTEGAISIGTSTTTIVQNWGEDTGSTGAPGTGSVTFTTNHADTNYSAVATYQSSVSLITSSVLIHTKTVSGFSYNLDGSIARTINWQTIGA